VSTGHEYWPVTYVTHSYLLTHLTRNPWPADSLSSLVCMSLAFVPTLTRPHCSWHVHCRYYFRPRVTHRLLDRSSRGKNCPHALQTQWERTLTSAAEHPLNYVTRTWLQLAMPDSFSSPLLSYPLASTACRTKLLSYTLCPVWLNKLLYCTCLSYGLPYSAPKPPKTKKTYCLLCLLWHT